MHICIAGGGKVGYHLARALLKEGSHTVTIIEPNPDTAHILANRLDIPVVCGDCTATDVLARAGLERCDVFVAVTGEDDFNLVACQLAKDKYHVGHTVARLYDPRNTELFRMLGVDQPICGTGTLTGILLHEIETEGIRRVLDLAGGTAVLSEITLPDSFALAGTPVKDMNIPKEVVLVGVTRDNDFLVPRGDTVLLGGDKILCVGKNDALRKLAVQWDMSRS